jgi:MFS family permease
MQHSEPKAVRRNFVVNVTDGGFFGLGMGLSSFVTVIPLFIATLTDSTVLIGLVGTLHVLGWQLPQLFTANLVRRQRRYLPFVLRMTLQERWPYAGMAFVALALALWGMDKTTALVLTFFFVILHSLGGGFTATAWQSMIGKIIPASFRGTFFGTQSGAANLFSSGGSFIAGLLLVATPYPYNYALCFFLTFVAMMVSFGFLAVTHEDEHEPVVKTKRSEQPFWSNLARILREDGNFRTFLGARIISTFGTMAVAFYAIYAVREYSMDAATAGLMASILTLAQTFASPIVGRLGDQYGHRLMFAAGNVLLGISVLLAMNAPSLTWFYVVFALAGAANSTNWTTILSITSEFGTDSERPFYIGLTNTLIAPATLAAPIIGGLVVDMFGFQTMFMVALLAGLLAAGVLLWIMRDPRKYKREERLAVATGD